MPVERFKRRLQLDGQALRVERLCFAAPLLRHPVADVDPQVAELGHVPACDVVGDRHARELDDAALDRVHEREVAHRPREERAFGIPGATEEERRGGEIDDAVDADLARHGLEAADPDPRLLLVLLRLLFLVPRQLRFSLSVLLAEVAVVGFVVQDHHVLHAHELGHDALQHLTFGLEGPKLLAAPLEQRAAALRQLQRVVQHERVVVGDDDLGSANVLEHVARHELPALVVAVGVVRLQDAQAFADREPGRHDEEAARESAAARAPDGVDRLPGDQHRHHGRLSRACRQFERQALESGVRIRAGARQVRQERLLLLAQVRSHLREPDHGLGGFDLTEERTEVAELVVAPVFEQALRLRSDVPLRGVRLIAPLRDVVANLVDDHVRGVDLVGGGEPLSLIERELLLPGSLALLRLRDRSQKGRTPPRRLNLVGWLALGIQLPVASRTLVRRVQNRLLEELVLHVGQIARADHPERACRRVCRASSSRDLRDSSVGVGGSQLLGSSESQCPGGGPGGSPPQLLGALRFRSFPGIPSGVFRVPQKESSLTAMGSELYSRITAAEIPGTPYPNAPRAGRAHSPVHVAAVADLDDGDDEDGILDRVHDPIVTTANAVLVLTRELAATRRARVVGKSEDRLNDALPILLQADGLEFLPSRRLDQDLISCHAAAAP